MACRASLHPYIRTLAAARAAVPDGIGWLAPNRFFALEVLRSYLVLRLALGHQDDRAGPVDQ
jgi:hypothetical protein